MRKFARGAVLAIPALLFVPAVVEFLLGQRLFAVALVAMPVAFAVFYPDAFVTPILDWVRRRRRLRAGDLDYPTIEWILDAMERRSTGPVGEDFWGDLAYRILDTMLSSDATGYGKAISAWCGRGEDPVVLRDALAAGLNPGELRAHLDGTNPLDPAAVATLAALSGDRPISHGSTSLCHPGHLPGTPRAQAAAYATARAATHLPLAGGGCTCGRL